MNKLIFFIIGLILIILGFFAFSYIGVINNYETLDSNTHLMLVAVGFILEFFGILSMILMIKKDSKSKVVN